MGSVKTAATGVSHIAVCVREMDKSLTFYRDILGMKVTKTRFRTRAKVACRTPICTAVRPGARSI